MCLCGGFSNALIFFDAQVVGDGERAGNAVGLNVGDILIGLGSYHPFEGHVSSLDDDVNRGKSA